MSEKRNYLRKGAPPVATALRCGLCKDVVSDKEKEFNYTTDCLVCVEKCWLHARCAQKLLVKKGGMHYNSKNHEATSATFRQTQIELWCSICEDPCFLCDVYHPSKFIIFLNVLFDIDLLI